MADPRRKTGPTEPSTAAAGTHDLLTALEESAGLGATVRVADDQGRTTEYDLIGRRSQDSELHEVTLASPVGEALWVVKRAA